MQPETQNPTPQEAPLFPPWLSLAAAALGLILAAGVAFTQPTFNLLGWAGLAIAIVGLIVWGLSNPQAIRNILRGRE